MRRSTIGTDAEIVRLFLAIDQLRWGFGTTCICAGPCVGGVSDRAGNRELK